MECFSLKRWNLLPYPSLDILLVMVPCNCLSDICFHICPVCWVVCCWKKSFLIWAAQQKETSKLVPNMASNILQVKCIVQMAPAHKILCSGRYKLYTTYGNQENNGLLIGGIAEERIKLKWSLKQQGKEVKWKTFILRTIRTCGVLP